MEEQNTSYNMNEQNAPYPMQGQSNNPQKKGKAGLGLTLVLIGWLILLPLGFILTIFGFGSLSGLSILTILGFILGIIGFVLIIWGLVLGIKARKISNSRLSLATIIIGIIALILPILTLPLTLSALTFSTVDYGGLLPNTLNFDHSFRANTSQMVIDDTDDTITIVAEYVGIPTPIEIDTTQVRFETQESNCDSSNSQEVTIRYFSDSKSTRSSIRSESIRLKGGTDIIITFNCPPNMITKEDSIEADITIPYTEMRSEDKYTATGTLKGAVTN